MVRNIYIQINTLYVHALAKQIHKIRHSPSISQ